MLSEGGMDLLGTQTTLARIGLHPGQRVLEIGPGTGRLLIPAARVVQPDGEVVGLDILPARIERLKAKAAQSGVTNLVGVVGDAAKSHFPLEHFDVIYLCTALGEIHDRPAALRQCFTMLKPGGTLSITEIVPDPHFQSQSKVRTLVEAVAFSFREVQGSWNFFTANFVKAD